MVKTKSTLLLQPGGGPSPPSGIILTSGMPPELSEFVELPALAVVESSPEALEVEDVELLGDSPLELVPGGAVVMLEPKPVSWPLPPLHATATRATARVRRGTRRRIAQHAERVMTS